jgi:hypothetical protein
MQEYETWVRSDDGTIENAKFIIEWQERIDEVSKAFGKQMNVAGLHKGYIRDAGFEDVTEVIHKVAPSSNRSLNTCLLATSSRKGPGPRTRNRS